MQRAEQEVVISKCADEETFTVYSTAPYYTRLFVRLANKVGGRVIEHQGGMKIFLPEDALRFVAKRQIILSDEERARRATEFRARLQRKTAP